MNTNSTSKGKNFLAGADSIFQKIVIAALDILFAVYTTVFPKISDLFHPEHGLVVSDIHRQPYFDQSRIYSFISEKKSIQSYAVSPVAVLHNDHNQNVRLQKMINKSSA